MKISKETLAIFKNFSMIRQGITVRADTPHVVTMSDCVSIVANAPIEETFPTDFTIYDIGQFLSTVSLFKEPEFEFNDDYVSITDGEYTTKATFAYASESLVKSPPKDEINLGDYSVELTLDQKTIKTVMKAANTQSLKDLRLINEGTDIFFQAYDKEGTTNNVFGIKVDENYEGEDFDAHLLATHMTMIPDDYSVGLIKADKIMLSQFTGTGDKPNRYWVALEPSSKL